MRYQQNNIWVLGGYSGSLFKEFWRIYQQNNIFLLVFLGGVCGGGGEIEKK